MSSQEGPVDPYEKRRVGGGKSADQDFNPFAGGSNDDEAEDALIGGHDVPQPLLSSKKPPAPAPAATASSKRPAVPQNLLRVFGGSDNAGGDELEGGAAEKKTIATWPYDDFHQVQQKYYEVIDTRVKEEQEQQDAAAANATPSYLTRPPDLPDIPTAVQGLPLVQFSEKAEERAIGIVSTWIFDAGLIDELLAGSASAVAAAPSSDVSVRTSEGVEVGVHGFAMESQKMDKEIEKLRESTQRELALINARLNDGVAASGSEVQELVHAVTATKGDLGRLGQLTTYISNGGDLQETHLFLLANYPKLKTAIHARRNLARCFRELDFFSQIPATCDRLRDELNACEWTDHEWVTIRNVCREHVELQIFLVEAEAGMKARMEQEQGSSSGSGSRRGGLKKSGNSYRYQPASSNYDAVDQFLSEHVKNVWELGDELQFRVLSGIGAAFDLAQANPEGMVALVEAVEVYENASDEFKRVHGSSAPRQNSLHFTDMRRAALEKIAEDFDVRGQEVFQQLQMQAANDAGSQDAEVAQFNAVLRAANNLTYQIELVKQTIAPCFPPFWNVETLWMTCVAAVCSQHILQQIGGQEGNNLEYMTVTQLLDLVAWIESFRQMAELIFPDIIKTNARKTKFVSVQELLAGKEIDMQSAKENMAHVINVLWDIHRLAQDQFIVRTQTQTNEWLDNVYNADHSKQQTSEGLLTTSLPEDVWALAGVQLRTIRERLTKRSSVLVDASSIVFRLMQLKQRSCRSRFIVDMETCCAAANDFLRMTEQAEEVLSDLEGESDLSDDHRNTLEEVANELMRQYSNDAVYAAQHLYKYVFQPLEEEIGVGLFTEEWEELTHNEMATTIVRTIEDYMVDIEEWMDNLMVRKAVDAMVKASINFYLQHLLTKGAQRSAKDACFHNPQRALQRIAGDIKVLQDYFEGQVETFPALGRVIESEFEVLKTVFDLLCIAAGFDEGSNPSDFFPILQKNIRNVTITRFMVGDLWHLCNPDGERQIYEEIDANEETLMAFDINDTYVDDQYIDPGLQLDRVVIGVVGESKRRRPMKKDAIKAMEKLFEKFGKPWTGVGESDDEGEFEEE